MKETIIKNRKYIYFFLFILTLFFNHPLYAKIKTANYWTSPVMSIEQARDLSKFDLVIVDMENIFNNKKSLRLMKSLNPNLKLLFYINPMEVYVPSLSERPLQTKILKELKKYPNWFLKRSNGDQAVFWPGMKMMNISALCPLYNNKTYLQWYLEIISKEVLDEKIWDGLFFDNGGGNISWLYDGSYQLDINGNGLADLNKAIDEAWYKGIHYFLSEVRKKKGNGFVILANKGSVEMLDVLNGRMFEFWPNDYLGLKINEGWNQCYLNAWAMEKEFSADYIIFQAKLADNLDYLIASAILLDNVYVAVGQDNPRTYSNFNLKTGKALDSAWEQDGVFYRDFENLRVIVRPSQKSAEFIFK